MAQAERMDKIMELLEKEKFLTVKQLVEKLNYSPASIRRDINELYNMNLIKKSWGGISIFEGNVSPYPFRLKYKAREKNNISTLAIELIEDGDVVFLDASTTTSYIVHHLMQKKDITVVTNNSKLLSYLQEYGIKTICTGGILSNGPLYGDITNNCIEKMHFNIAFFSVTCMSNEGDLMNFTPTLERFIRLLVENSDKKVLLVDYDKVGVYGTYKVGSLDDMDYVISDKNIKNKLTKKYANLKFLNT